MTYATQSRMVGMFGEREIIELTDHAQAGTVDDGVLALALSAANATVDAALAGRYALPLASIPDMLANAACDLARFILYTNAPDETVKARWAAAQRLLADLRDGKSLLLDPATGQCYPAPATGSGIACAASPWALTDDLLALPT